MKFISEFRSCEHKVLCNIILSRLTIGPFRRAAPSIQRVQSLVILFVIYELSILIVLLISSQPIKPVLIASVIAALVASLSIFVVSWCYQFTYEQVKSAVNLSPIAEALDIRLSTWIRRMVNPWTQLSASIVAIMLIALAIYFIAGDASLLFKNGVAKFVAIGMAGFGMGQGAYWAIVTPLFTTELRKGDISELNVDPLYPTTTPLLVAASKVLSVFSIWDAVMVTLCLAGLFSLRPDLRRGAIAYPLVVVLIGYLVTSWTFLFPQFNLAQILQSGKRNTLFQLQEESNKIFKRLDGLENHDFERLEQLMKLHEAVRKGPNTMINFLALRSFIGSILTPTLAAIIGVVDWKGLLQKLPPPL